ncbi:MAG: hypothetical protein ACPG19_07620 [Saprospiraceae bacterium]
MNNNDFIDLSETELIKHILHYQRVPIASINSLAKLLLQEEITKKDRQVFIEIIDKEGRILKGIEQSIDKWLKNKIS